MNESFDIPLYRYVIGEENKQSQFDLVFVEVDEENKKYITKITSFNNCNINHPLESLFQEKLIFISYDKINELLEYHYSLYKGEKELFINYTLRVVLNYYEQAIKNNDSQRELIYEKGINWLNGKKGIRVKNNIINDDFVHQELIKRFEKVSSNRFNTNKLSQFLIEVNTSFSQQNYISTILLLRAFINHIPPVFNYNSFSEYVNSRKKTLKELFLQLENGARKIADYHTHFTITRNEDIPSINQIYPFSATFELLLKEILSELE